MKKQLKDQTYWDTWETRDKALEGGSYQEFLKSDHWKETKAKARSRDCYSQCERCGSNDRLELHHKEYKWLGTPHELRAIVAMCRICHEDTHLLAREAKISVRLATNMLINPRTHDVPVSTIIQRFKNIETINASSDRSKEFLAQFGLYRWPLKRSFQYIYLQGVPLNAHHNK